MLHGAGKYHGAIATGYDAKRQESPKWHAEDRIIKGYLSDLPKGSWILDCPVGTGRFLPYYQEKGFQVRGLDLSEDMLFEAREKITKPELVRLRQGDVRATGLADKSVDAALMCRLTRWLSPEDCQRAMIELQRVARDRIIFTARVRDHPHARPYELFTSVLSGGWHIAQDEEADGPAYRVIMLRPT